MMGNIPKVIFRVILEGLALSILVFIANPAVYVTGRLLACRDWVDS